jgi:chloramphenicol 3-O-phosphotransferase
VPIQRARALDGCQGTREAQGGADEPIIGLARRQYSSAHTGKEYDFKIDTTIASAAHCAAQVASWLNTRPIPRAFGVMSSK